MALNQTHRSNNEFHSWHPGNVVTPIVDPAVCTPNAVGQKVSQSYRGIIIQGACLLTGPSNSRRNVGALVSPASSSTSIGFLFAASEYINMITEPHYLAGMVGIWACWSFSAVSSPFASTASSFDIGRRTGTTGSGHGMALLARLRRQYRQPEHKRPA